MRFKKERFQIKKRDGKKELVSGFIMGDFGYHKVVESKLYNVTHIPSGMFIQSKLSLKEARELSHKAYLSGATWNGKGDVPFLFLETLKNDVLIPFRENK